MFFSMENTFSTSVERLIEFSWCRLADAVDASIKSIEVDLIKLSGRRHFILGARNYTPTKRLSAAARSKLMYRKLSRRALSLVPFPKIVARWRLASLNFRKRTEGHVCLIKLSTSSMNFPPRRTRSFFGSTNSLISSSKA